MKKNIQINLFGTLFNIDEDAYQLLDNYLQSMKRYFSTQESGEEVADDIEHRVAELLWEKKEQGLEAVSVDVIKEIIGKIGNPQEICGEEDKSSADHQDTESQDQQGTNGKSDGMSDRGWQERLGDAVDAASESAETAYNKVKSNIAGKKLYRDPMDKVLGGVCSGLAKYFGGDPVLWRLIIILVFLLEGFGLILYIVLWIVIPEAKTPEDRLRMEGQSVNPDTLNQQIIKEQDYIPRQNSNNGCLTVCLLVLAIPILLVAISCIIGLIGGAIGLLGGATGGLLGGLFEVLGEVTAIPFEILFGTSHVAGVASIIVGVILVLAALLTTLIFLIKSRVNGSMRKSTKWIFAIVIIACLIFGFYNIKQGRLDYEEVERVDIDDDLERLDDAVDDLESRVDDLFDGKTSSDSVVTVVCDTIVKGDTTIIKTKRKSKYSIGHS